MITSYNRIAGQSVERLAALSDGIFGVAMTLLAIDLRVPASELIHHEHDLRHELFALSPEVLVYLMSFLTLGIFWVGQQSQLNHLRRSDIRLTWIHLAFLFAVTLMPFSTKLLGAHHAYRTALLEYWGNILIFGATLYASWTYATRAGLVKDDISPEVTAAVCRRIIIRSVLVHLRRAALLLQHLPQHARRDLRPTVLHSLAVAPPPSHRKLLRSSRRSITRSRSLFLWLTPPWVKPLPTCEAAAPSVRAAL